MPLQLLSPAHGSTAPCATLPNLGAGARLTSATLQVRAVAPTPAAEEAAGPSPVNVEYLAAEFAGHGVSFGAVGRSCAGKMALRNGRVAHLLLPSGLVTSYKPAMWHGSVTEVLHTDVAAGPGGRAVIHGGVSVDLRCAGGDGGWSPSGAWSLCDVRGNPATTIVPCSKEFLTQCLSFQIELASAAPGDAAEARCVVALHPEALATELSATNNAASSSPMALPCAVSNHLRVSTPDATYALGLQGSDYRSVEPALSEFSIIPPDYGAARHRWANKGFDMVLSGSLAHGEEDDDYTHLTEMCRVYSNAPREFTIIDRGRRNSICLHRWGFEGLYVFSPGSQYQWYGNYAYVVVGPAMLEPAVLGPGDTWQSAQCLRNPNL